MLHGFGEYFRIGFPWRDKNSWSLQFGELTVGTEIAHTIGFLKQEIDKTLYRKSQFVALLSNPFGRPNRCFELNQTLYPYNMSILCILIFGLLSANVIPKPHIFFYGLLLYITFVGSELVGTENYILVLLINMLYINIFYSGQPFDYFEVQSSTVCNIFSEAFPTIYFLTDKN